MVLFLNLLPQKERKKLILEKIYRVLRRQMIFIAFLMIIVGGGAWFYKKNLENRIKEIDVKVEENKELHKSLILKVQRANQTAEYFQTMQDDFNLHSKLLTSLSILVPSDIQLTFISLQFTDNLVMLKGSYATRAGFTRFEENLEKTFIVNMESPISNILKEHDGVFIINGMINPDLLKKVKSDYFYEGS